MIIKARSAGETATGRTWILLLAVICISAGCEGPSTHFVGPQGNAMPELDYLYMEVDQVFPDALPDHVTLLPVSGPHAVFMIETNSIGISTRYESRVRRGKICRELTHLALHYLSGGEPDRPGRCFDNDVVFLRQAIAGYMDRKAMNRLEQGVEESSRTAARLFREGKLTVGDLRDWEAFFFRGYWTDQYTRWNLEGMESLLSLGDFLNRKFGLSALGPVFEQIGEGGSLDQAVKELLGADLNQILRDWQDEVLTRNPAEIPPPEAGDALVE